MRTFLRLIYIFLLIISFPLISESNPPLSAYGVNLITGRLENDSSLHFEIYQPGHNAVGREDIVLSKKDFRIGRIKLVEIKREPHPIYVYFYYTPDSTKMVEQPNSATVYCYDRKGVLHAIEQYSIDQQIETFYRRERLFWDPIHPSTLSSRVIENTEGKALVCDYFLYDQKGQLIRKSLAGQLSGTCSFPLVIQKNGHPLENGIDIYHTYYTYSDDENHLLLSEHEDNGRFTRYQYDPKTKNCIAKLKGSTEEIFSRCFYRYDDHGFLFQTIIDDGDGIDWQDLNGISYRQTIECQISADPLTHGQPLCNQTFYWDLTHQKNVLMERSTYTYGTRGELIRESFYDANDTLIYYIHHNYDEEGHPISVVDSRGEVGLKEDNPHQERFDAWDQRIGTTDSYGNTTHYGYDPFGRLIAIQSPRVLNIHDQSYHPITTHSYNVLDQLISICDANEELTTMSYNHRNQPLSISYPDDTEEVFVYFLDGEMQQKKNRDGTYVLFSRDYASRLIKSEKYSANGQILQQLFYTYKGEKVETISDHQTFTLTHLYDDASRQIGTLYETKDGTRKLTWEYDARGRKTNVREWFGLDEGDFLLKKDDLDKPASKNPSPSCLHFSSSSTKNSLGQHVKQEEWVDEEGIKEIKIYDALQRLDSCIKWNAFGVKIGERHYRYDGNGNLLRETHVVLANGTVYHHFTIERSYDTCNRLISISEQTDQTIKTTRYHYVNGKINEVIKPNGISLYYLYNEKGELCRWYASDQSLDYHYEYDISGHLIACYDACHQLTQNYRYNAFNEIIEDKQSSFFSLCYQYDLAGRRTQALFPDGTAVAYHYTDELLTCIERLHADQTVNYFHQNHYNESKQLQTSDLIKGLGTIFYTFDESGCPTAIQSDWWSQKIEMERKRDIHRPVYIQTNDAQGTFDAHYVYGENEELIEETGHSYTYDSLFNRLSDNDNQWEMNQLNQLIKNPHYQLLYDLNGCISEQIFENGEVIHFSYDAADRLIRVEHPHQFVVNYWYDTHHRRLGRKTKYWNGQTNRWTNEQVCHFIYDQKNEFGQLDEKGSLIALRILDYSRGSETGAAIALEINHKLYAPIHNLQGSMSCLIDCDNRSIAESYRYSAFGIETIYDSQQELINESKIGNPWRYASKRKDDLTQFVYFGYRDYSPTLGRWITPDPLLYVDTPNVYAYVKNDPINLNDQYGLFSVQAAWNTALDCLYKGFQYIQTSSNQFRSRISAELKLNASIIQSFERIGKQILTESTYLLMGYDLDHTHISSYGKKDINDKVRITYINGMLTTNTTMLQNLEVISDAHGGAKIHYVFRPTEGWTWDLFRAFHIRFLGFRSKYTHLLAHLWKNLIHEMGGVKGGGVIIHYAHSLGGSETDRARELLSNEEQAMIRVITLGSATIIHNTGFHSVKNHMSIRDPIPVFSEFVKTIGHMFNPLEHAHYYGTWLQYPYLYIEHSLAGTTYKSILQQCGEEFLAEFNLN